MFPVLNIGPLALQLPGLVVLIGIWLGLSLAERLAKSIKASELYNLVLITLLCGVIGARLGYVLDYPDAFAENPLNILSLNLSMFNLYAGLGACLIVAIVYAQWKQLSFWSTLDALTPFFAVISIALGVSHLTSGRGFGSPADLPWSIQLWGSLRHPTQIYEIILSTLILVFIIIWVKRVESRIDGILFLTFLALTASTRLFTEAFRGDSILTITGIRTAQLAAWFILALSLWALGKRFSENKISSENHINSNPSK
jgi:prolipoprotein diacylglyceryltransferase